MDPQAHAQHAVHWTLDPDVVFLNHGSYGACPTPVLDAQAALRAQLERQPLRFFAREFQPMLDHAREALCALVCADPEDLVFVDNATAGVNTVLRSLALQPGDELLTTDHAYNACVNAMRAVAAQSGARVVVAAVPFPLSSDGQVVQAVLSCVTARTRLVLLDHVTSPTGLIFPIERLVRELGGRGVLTLIDGAHAPGMLALDLRALGADYYTGNCHKWLCTPKSAGFLYVSRARQAGVRPLVISHGANAPLRGRSRFWHEFDWVGTRDPTPFLCVPYAIAFLSGLYPGGMKEHLARNHALAIQGRDILCNALGAPVPCPDAMLGSLATVLLPDGSTELLHDVLLARHHIEVQLPVWPSAPRRLLRISAQAYNHVAQYGALVAALREEGLTSADTAR
jgi:isopenicillin-N epimerase